jgi:hypothetical protein
LILIAAAGLADIGHFVDLAEIERIEVNQLREAEFAEDFFPELNGGFEAGWDRKRRGCRIEIRGRNIVRAGQSRA